MTKQKTQKTVSAKALVEKLDALAALAREDYREATFGLADIVSEAETLQGAARAAFIKGSMPKRNELVEFIAVYDDLIIPAKAALKAAAAKDDLPVAQAQAGKMLDGLEALAAINPDLAAKFEAHERRLAALEASDKKQDAELEKLWAAIDEINARDGHIEGYLFRATSGKGFEPYVPFGTPKPVDPAPQVPQASRPITDAESLAAAAGADDANPDDDTSDSQSDGPKKGWVAVLKERIGLGRGSRQEEGQGYPDPRQYFGPRKDAETDNPSATAGGAH